MNWLEFLENILVNLNHVETLELLDKSRVGISLTNGGNLIRSFETDEQAQAYYEKIKKILFHAPSQYVQPVL